MISNTLITKIDIQGEHISNVRFIDRNTMAVGTQLGSVYVVKFNWAQKDKPYTLINSFNHNCNFYVTDISVMPGSETSEDPVFAVSFADGFIKVFSVYEAEAVMEYQSMNVR